MDHWLTATWHYGGAQLSGDLCQGGAHLLTWTNGRVPRGTWLLRWLNQGLPRGIGWVRWLLCWGRVWVPKLYPKCVISPSCTQRGLDQISALWSAYLICFIFSKFILIAPLTQKSWNFHRQSVNLFYLLFKPSIRPITRQTAPLDSTLDSLLLECEWCTTHETENKLF
jgi:hypothetical protein